MNTRIRKIEIEFVDQAEASTVEEPSPIRIRFDANRMHYKKEAVEQAYNKIQKLLREMHMDPFYAEEHQLY
jgi:hypothetical protein